MKILVTGGAGFVGSNFINYMLKKYDYKIINLDKLTYAGNLENLVKASKNNDYTFVKGDICDKELVLDLLSNCDAIINFAAESHVDRSIESPDIFIQTNVNGTVNLLNCARAKKIERFIQISTDEVYGSIKEGYFTETTPINPNSPYSASKASSDLIARAYFETFKMNINITNCSNNYGAYQHNEKLIPHIISLALKDEKLPVYGDGRNIRDWLYVEDHCKAIDLVFHNGEKGERYNIGGHNEKRNIEIVKLILKHLGKSEDLIEYVTDRKGHDYRYAIDPTKIKEQLGWEPETKFEDGIIKTIDWYLEHKEYLDI